MIISELIRKLIESLQFLLGGNQEGIGGELAFAASGVMGNYHLAASSRKIIGSSRGTGKLGAEQVLLRRLQAGSLALARALLPEEVLRIAASSIRDILSCDVVWILLADENGEYLETCRFVAPEENQSPEVISITAEKINLRGGESLLATVFRGGDPLFMDDLASQNRLTESDPMLLNLIDSLGISSLNLVPLSLSDGNIGIIAFGKTGGEPLAVEEKRIMLVFAHQVTISLERARLYTREQESTAELARLNELKSRLLHILSHELKTPLTALKTSTAFLKEYDQLDAGTRKRLVENISRSTERLISVADDIYPIADVLTAGVKIEREDIDCRQVILEAIKTVWARTNQKDQTVKTTVVPSAGLVRADKERLKQVLVNLLTNASNFSPEGSVINVTVRDEGSDVVFGVSDQGIGISEEDQKSVFAGFYQADDETVRRAGGKGIGLLLAKTIAELHGGRIWVESEPDEGSTFYFSIPR